MKFIDNEHDRDLVDISITVDLAKLKDYGSFQYIQHTIEQKDINPNYIELIANMGLKRVDKSRFDERLTEILIEHYNERKLKQLNLNLDQQKDEIIFIVDYLKDSGRQYNLTMVDNNFETFREIVELMDMINQIDDSDGLKFTFIKENVYPNPTIVLPKAKDPRKLYEHISWAVRSYFLTEGRHFGLNWYLSTAYKDGATLDKMKAKVAQEKISVQPDPLTVIGFYATSLLKYVSKMPQFPPNKLANSPITTKQGEFILKLMQMFGLDNQSFKLNYSQMASKIDLRELKRIHGRFIKNFGK